MRKRTICPWVCTDEKLAVCSFAAQLLFERMSMAADREGRLEDRPLKIRAHLLPHHSVDVDSLLTELEAQEFLVRYTIEDSKFIQLTTFKQDQSPHVRELASTIPSPYPQTAPTQAMPSTNLGALDPDPDPSTKKVPKKVSSSRQTSTPDTNGVCVTKQKAKKKTKPKAEIDSERPGWRENAKEVADGVWLLPEEIARLKADFEPGELRYWVRSVSEWKYDNPTAYKKKLDHNRLIRKWRKMRREKGQVWSRIEKEYRPKWLVDKEQQQPKAPPAARKVFRAKDSRPTESEQNFLELVKK